MRVKFYRMYVRFREWLRLLQLFFLYVPEPEDAMSEEEMLKEIKRKSGLT